MGEFLKTWYGLTLFVVFDAAAVIAVMAIAYRWFFKRFWDMLVSLICMAALSPVYLAVVIRGKIFQKRTGAMKSLLTREFYVGKKAKTIVLHSFCTVDDEGGEAGKYGRWLRRTGLYKLPYLADVFCGRLSFIGVRKFTFAEAAFVSESDEERFGARPGLIDPLAVTGDADTDYQEMFASDVRYARRVSLFGDLKIFFIWLLKKIRGGKSREWLGVTADKTYAQALLEEGGITREDFDVVAANAAAETAQLHKKYEEAEESEEEEEPDEPAADTDEPDAAAGDFENSDKSEP